ncbi:MFS transporter [uncultured Caulobacter sp.]|uniref:MFS transporter n=1 Tax=uncultured Caulobacter sp. TaxID=158749 RepID=UPI002601F7FA|nr:MFS transporter [uncultured Caulobacter sp.]
MRKGGWFTLWVMLAISLFAFVDRQVLVLASAPIAGELGLSDGQIGVVQGLAFAVFTILASYPLAWIADRFDRRYVICGCIATWTIGTAACGFAQNFEQLFCAAVLIAAGEAGLVPISWAIVPDLFSGRKRVLANSLFYFFAYLGISLGLALGGVALSGLERIHGQLPASLQTFSPWRLSFFVVCLPAPILMMLAMRATLRRPETPDKAQPAVRNDEFSSFLRTNVLTIGSIFVGLATYVLAFGGYLAWLPVVATRLFGTTAAENGFGLGLATALGTVGGVGLGLLLMRQFIAKHGPSASLRVMWITVLAGTPFIFLFPFIAAAWQGYLLFSGLMVIGTAIGSLVPGVLQDIAPASVRARVTATYTIVQGLIGGSAPSLVGWVSGGLGHQPRDLIFAVTIVALPSWIAALCLFKFAERPFGRLSTLVATQAAATEAKP